MEDNKAPEQTGEEQEFIVDEIRVQHVLKPDGTRSFGIEFSDELPVAEALMMLEFARLELYSGALRDDPRDSEVEDGEPGTGD